MKDINLPTKSELLGQALVVIDNEHKNVTTNTLKVAEYFGKRPADINRRIAGLVKNSRCKIAPSKYIDDRGKERIYYILDRKNFSIVVLGFTGEQAEVFRIEYVEQFEKHVAELIEWRKTRQTVIEPTKTCNDSIEWLRLELIKEIPESSKPKFLYINIQSAITKAATGNARTKREIMTSEQLKVIEWIEVRVHDEIERMRALNISAVEIRESILETLKAE